VPITAVYYEKPSNGRGPCSQSPKIYPIFSQPKGATGRIPVADDWIHKQRCSVLLRDPPLVESGLIVTALILPRSRVLDKKHRHDRHLNRNLAHWVLIRDALRQAFSYLRGQD
jgi:hypothetical protein